MSVLPFEEGQKQGEMDKGEEAWARCPQGCWEILGHPATLRGPGGDTRSGRLVWLGQGRQLMCPSVPELGVFGATGGPGQVGSKEVCESATESCVCVSVCVGGPSCLGLCWRSEFPRVCWGSKCLAVCVCVCTPTRISGGSWLSVC